VVGNEVSDEGFVGERAVLAAAGEKENWRRLLLGPRSSVRQQWQGGRGAVLSCALLRCRVESKAMSVRARGKAHFFGPWATNERGLIALADFKAQQSDMTIGTTACVYADLKIMPP
jgi:hypothetical protein